MGSCLVEIGHIGIVHALELPLMQDQQVVQAFLSDAPQIAFADGIGSWCMIRRFQYLDAAGSGHARERGPEFANVITNEIFRRSSIRSRLPQLLGGPGVGRRTCDTHMNDSPRLHIDNEEGKQRMKEKVGDLQEITCPAVFGMRVQEGGPILSSLSR